MAETTFQSSFFLLLLQGLAILFYGIFTEYHEDANILNIASAPPDAKIYTLYGMFQDIHVMMFIGFGFLMTFLGKFWFSAVGMNFWLAALTLQWYILVSGFWEKVLNDEWQHKIFVSIEKFIWADFGAASILICFGALLGKATFVQMTIVAILQLIFYSLNEAIAVYNLKISDIGGSMLIHTFGAFFGITVSFFVTDKKTLEKCNHLEKSNYTSDVFSMIGTIFLWMYWPSFNAATAFGDARERAVIHTILSLVNSNIFAFIVSRMVNHGKFDMVHIQNSTLAGGVAIGAVANLPINNYSAMIIGGFAGTISVLGFKYLQPFVRKKFHLHDTCGILNLHAIPGVLGGIASGIAAAHSDEETYGPKLSDLFYMRTKGRSPIEQGAFQILCLVMSMGIAIFSGIFTGIVLKLFTKNATEYFQDGMYWEVGDGYYVVDKKNPYVKPNETEEVELVKKELSKNEKKNDEDGKPK